MAKHGNGNDWDEEVYISLKGTTMNTETNTQPLYLALNEKRTAGNVEIIKHHTGVKKLVANGNYLFTQNLNGEMTKDEYEANAQYTALAVNNLASVADALAELYALAYQWANDKEDETLVKAKEALKRIS